MTKPHVIHWLAQKITNVILYGVVLLYTTAKMRISSNRTLGGIILSLSMSLVGKSQLCFDLK